LKFFISSLNAKLLRNPWREQLQRGKFIDGYSRDTVYSHTIYYTAFHHINNYGDTRY